APGAESGLLDGVLCRLAIVEHAVGQPEGWVDKRPDQGVEGVAVACLGLGDELSRGDVCHRLRAGPDQGQCDARRKARRRRRKVRRWFGEVGGRYTGGRYRQRKQRSRDVGDLRQTALAVEPQRPWAVEPDTVAVADRDRGPKRRVGAVGDLY